MVRCPCGAVPYIIFMSLTLAAVRSISTLALIEPGTAPVTSTPTSAPVSRSPTLVNETFAPVPAPTAYVPTCAPTSSLVTRDFCPCGYHDYGVRYNLGLGRITVVVSHRQCADRCTTFSGPQFAGGCKGFMTGMYMNMVFCRSYGSRRIATPCPAWANPSNPGQYSGPLGRVSSVTGQENIGGNCCSNTTFVDASGSVVFPGFG